MTDTFGDDTGPIVVGVDGSPTSSGAAAWAVRQASLTGATVEVVTTWEWPASYGWSLPLPEGFDPAADCEKVAETVLAPLRRAHPDVDITTTVVEGHPAPVLVERSHRAQLLVVGNRGHGEFAGMLIGSVSEHCVTNAHCPVLVYREGS